MLKTDPACTAAPLFHQGAGQSPMAKDSASAMRRPLPPAANPLARVKSQMGRRNNPAIRGLREHLQRRG